MALQILRQPSLGGQIGEAFGTGLGSGLQSLAQLKLSQMQQRQQQAGAMPILEKYFSPEEAKQIAPLASTNPQVFSQILKSKIEQPQREEIRKEKLEQQQFRSQLAIEKANEPYITRSDELSDVSERVLKEIDNSLDILKRGDATVGPLAGRIPAFGAADQDLENSLKNILLSKAALERIPGQRASKMFLQLQEQAKPRRELRRDVLIKKLENMRKGAVGNIKEKDIIQDIISSNEGRQPHDIRTLSKKIKRQVSKLPDFNEFKEGQLAEMNGYLFKRGIDRWVYQGKV